MITIALTAFTWLNLDRFSSISPNSTRTPLVIKEEKKKKKERKKERNKE